MKYDAFLSYSHSADRALAAALQSALHGFLRPWNKRRALWVFRDQTSLAASPALWPAIEVALAESRHLLLMASPAAAGSIWVDREIAWWLQHRSAQTLLILVTDGDLVWDEATSDFDWQRSTCLPQPALGGRLAAEPLWVDLRWAHTEGVLDLRHTRFRQAVLDIAAPLHGRDKDEMDGEDVHRHASAQRLRRAVVAGLAGLTTVAVVAAVIAVRARDDAERQARVAQAGHLSAQADLLRERGGATDASVMLAAEALRLLSTAGRRSMEVDLSMRRALAALPAVVVDIDTPFQPDTLSPDGSVLVTHRIADDLIPFDLPAGTAGACHIEAIAALDSAPGSRLLRLVRAISADGRFCIVQQFDTLRRNTLELWSAQPLQRIDAIALDSQAGHLRPALANGGEFIALDDRAQLGGAEAAVFRLWSRSRGAEVQRRPGVEFRGFSPDGRHFATTDALWRLPTGAVDAPEPVLRWPGAAEQLVFSRDGSHVAVRAAFDSPVQVWALASPATPREAQPPNGSLLAVRDDGLQLIVADPTVGRTRTVTWDVGDHTERAAVPLEAAAAVFGPRSASFVTRALQRSGLTSLRVLSMPLFGAARAGTELPMGDTVQGLVVADSHIDVLVASDGGLRLSRWDSGRDAWSDTARWSGATVSTVSDDGRSVAVASGRHVVVTWLDGSAKSLTFEAAAPPTLLALGADGRHVAALAGGTVQVWATGGGGAWTHTLPGRATALAVSADGVYGIAVTAEDRATRGGTLHTLWRWRLADPADTVAVDLGRELQPLDTACMVSSDGRSLRSGGALWPLAAASAPRRIGDGDRRECLAALAPPLRLQADGRRLTVVDAARATPLAQLDHAADIRLSAASASGRTVASVDAAGVLQVFALMPADLIAQACERRPLPLAADLRKLLPAAAQAVDACGRG